MKNTARRPAKIIIANKIPKFFPKFLVPKNRAIPNLTMVLDMLAKVIAVTAVVEDKTLS